MDPNATLLAFWKAVEHGEIDDALDHQANLKRWLRQGGFEPDWRASGRSRKAFMEWTPGSFEGGSASGLSAEEVLFGPMPSKLGVKRPTGRKRR